MCSLLLPGSRGGHLPVALIEGILNGRSATSLVILIVIFISVYLSILVDIVCKPSTSYDEYASVECSS